MLNAESIGKYQYLEFIQNRIETNEVDFYAPIKQNKLNTFESAVNVRKVKVNGKEVAVRSDRDTFALLLILQKTWGIQLQEILQYELASVPLALSDPDASSSLCKTAESELLKYLKKSIPAMAAKIHQKYMMVWSSFRNSHLI